MSDYYSYVALILADLMGELATSDINTHHLVLVITEHYTRQGSATLEQPEVGLNHQQPPCTIIEKEEKSSERVLLPSIQRCNNAQ